MDEFQKHKLPNFYGGIAPDIPDHVIDDTTVSLSDNYVLRKEGMVAAPGWQLFTDQQLTDGEASPTALEIIGYDEYFRNDNTSDLLCYTNKRVYYFDSTNTNLWIPITPVDHLDTTVDADSPSGATLLNVASTTGYAVNDRIIINDGGAREEEGVIASIAAGVSFTMLANLAFTHTAVQADAVRKLEHRAIVDADSTSGTTTLNVDYTVSFAAGEMILVGRGTARAEYLLIDSITAGVSLTVSRPTWAPSGTGLQYTHTAAQADTVIRMADLQYSSSATGFSATIAENVYYFCSLVHPVMQWIGTTNFATKLVGLRSGDSVEGLGTLTADLKAAIIYFFESFLVLGNLVENGSSIPQKIRWSRFANYTSWVNNIDGSGQAGAFLFFGADFVMNILQLKRELFFYRERSIEAMTYVGPPDIMNFRRAETGTGLLGKDSIIDFGDSHMYMGPDNLWDNNGINVIPIGDSFKTEFFSRLDPSQRSRVKLFFQEEVDEVLITYSTSGTNAHEYAWVYNIALKKFSGPRDVDASGWGYYTQSDSITWDSLVGSWDSQPEIWDSSTLLANNPINLMGNSSGYTFVFGTGITKNGVAITSKLRSKRTDLGDASVKKRIQMVKAGASYQGSGSLSVYIKTSNGIDDPFTTHGPYSLSLDASGEPMVYFDVTDRYCAVELQGTIQHTMKDLELYFMPAMWR